MSQVCLNALAIFDDFNYTISNLLYFIPYSQFKETFTLEKVAEN